EGIDDARDARAMMRDRLGFGVPDVAAGPADLSARVLARGNRAMVSRSFPAPTAFESVRDRRPS
ncbi:MAG: hypothetical protein ACYCVV_20930, partial [Acidimicrobiales bacterium]